MDRHTEIRPAHPDDLPGIVAIERIPEYRSAIAFWSIEEHRHVMASTDAEYFVAADGQAVQAFAILQETASPHRSILLRRFAVRSPGHGLGRRMLAHIAAHVFEHHQAHRLWLDVFESNQRARALYASFGFCSDGILREAILRDGEYHTQIVMSLLDREYRARRR